MQEFQDMETKNMKLKRLANLPTEPPNNAEKITQLVVRLSDGSKVSRKFSIYEKMQVVFDFIDTKLEDDISKYQVVTNFPQQIYSNPEETIEQAKLYPQALLFLQEKSSTL